MAESIDNSVGDTSNPVAATLFNIRTWWRTEVIGTVDQQAVIEKRREDALLSERYLFMTAMSGGIAILGLLLSSPAVVIGAMLLSPLMGPIIGLGFALAIGDYNWLRKSARSLAWGTAMAVFLCALVVFLSPIQTVTPEIAARTRPNLFDLLVAFFSALAGAYAMIRGREGTIVGVAIATALMPPLAVVGFGLATLNWTVFSGALLLYVTNLLTIALTAWGMVRLYGFRSTLTERQSQFQNFVVIAVFIALAVPLALSLRQIGWEYSAQRVVKSELQDAFDAKSRVSQVDINFAARPITIDATVLTPELRLDAEEQVKQALSRRLDREIQLVLTQYQVGTSATAAERAQIAAARAKEEAAAQRRAEDLANRLALVAGVKDADVTIDRLRRRAVVRAKVLDGASLTAYRTLEERIAATEPDWVIEVIPPLRPLPPIAFERKQAEGEDGSTMGTTPAGTRDLQTLVWAAERTGMPVVVSGPRQLVDIVRRDLEAEGVSATDGTITQSGVVVSPRWNDLD